MMWKLRNSISSKSQNDLENFDDNMDRTSAGLGTVIGRI
jgi:hypothetical protein